MDDHDDCSKCPSEDQLNCLWNEFQDKVRGLLDETLDESDDPNPEDSAETQDRRGRFPIELADGLLSLVAEIYYTEGARLSDALYQISSSYENLQEEEPTEEGAPPSPPSNSPHLN